MSPSARGLTIDKVRHAHRLFLSAHLDLFEEVAESCAAGVVWATLMSERCGAPEDSCRLNTFLYTPGSWQQEPFRPNRLLGACCRSWWGADVVHYVRRRTGPVVVGRGRSNRGMVHVNDGAIASGHPKGAMGLAW